MNYKETKTGTTALFKQNNTEQKKWVEVKEVITSGTLLSIQAFKKTGRMRDDFFMYYVDHEYCARLRMNGFKIVLVTEIGMMHSTGQGEIKHILGQDFVMLHYPPVKLYYIVRNGLLLTRDFFFKDTRWAIKRLWVVIKRVISNILFEDDKLQRLKYAFLGTQHAILNRTGKLKDS
jgi:rhamnosyltransferase